MNILVLGAGGREHALAWKLAQSDQCEALYIAPGNAGTLQHGTNVALDPMDFEAVGTFASEKAIDLVVVGPEQPLVAGIADALEAQGIAVVGPSQAAAQLEGSKAFSKRFMHAHQIPTAAYRSFSEGQQDEALAYLETQALPVVIKADGLAAGKGVLICETLEHAREVVADMLSGKSFGQAGQTIVIEQFLRGIEISIFVLSDGSHYLTLPSAKDYKRIGEGDTGLNTGGMGAVSPVPFADEAFLLRVDNEIIHPTFEGLKQEGIAYKGFLFIGLMVVDGNPYVLEYNVRMGDPETEVVIPRLKNDLLPLLKAATDGSLDQHQLEVMPETCTTVMLVSGGYPESYVKGTPMYGLEQVRNVQLFHAGTRKKGDLTLTNGGRVIAVSAFGQDVAEATANALRNAVRIEFEGKYYRQDIGLDLITGPS